MKIFWSGDWWEVAVGGKYDGVGGGVVGWRGVRTKKWTNQNQTKPSSSQPHLNPALTSSPTHISPSNTSSPIKYYHFPTTNLFPINHNNFYTSKETTQQPQLLNIQPHFSPSPLSLSNTSSPPTQHHTHNNQQPTSTTSQPPHPNKNDPKPNIIYPPWRSPL